MVQNRKEPVILFLGDILFFFVALWLTLFVRYGELPTQDLLVSHLTPFSILFLSWVVVFFMEQTTNLQGLR